MASRTLKNLAMNAKNRLIQKSGIVPSVTTNSSLAKFKLISNDDDAIYDKVRFLIENNSTSPMRELMDKKKYDSLTDFGKQKYLLDMLDKFQTIKRQIECEKEQNFVY